MALLRSGPIRSYVLIKSLSTGMAGRTGDDDGAVRANARRNDDALADRIDLDFISSDRSDHDEQVKRIARSTTHGSSN